MSSSHAIVKTASPYRRYAGMPVMVYIATKGLREAELRLDIDHQATPADHVRFTKYCITHPVTGKRVIAQLIGTRYQLSGRKVAAGAELWDWTGDLKVFEEIEESFSKSKLLVDSHF